MRTICSKQLILNYAFWSLIAPSGLSTQLHCKLTANSQSIPRYICLVFGIHYSPIQWITATANAEYKCRYHCFSSRQFRLNWDLFLHSLIHQSLHSNLRIEDSTEFLGISTQEDSFSDHFSDVRRICRSLRNFL